VIKYLGSKRLLLPHILAAVAEFPSAATVLDLFSGTSRVGHALKRAGYRVLSNDHNAYAHTLARCYVEADAEDSLAPATALIGDLNSLLPEGGGVAASATEGATASPCSYPASSPLKPADPANLCLHSAIRNPKSAIFTATYCHDSRFLHPKNGPRVAAVRERIDELNLPADLRAIALTSLLEAADRVDSTTGVQMAYLKSWAPRALNDLHLRLPDLLPRSPHGKGQAHCLDAIAAAATLEADIAYLDPPYNQHSYLGNYHLWETLVRWDNPATYGAARKREDCRTRRSPFNSRTKIRQALADCLAVLRADVIILSFSNEGFLSAEDVQSLLADGRRREVSARSHDHKRYVGAQIGIYNPAGQKVGRVSHLRNTEHLFTARPAPVTYSMP
jgi:adenine-specific DNA-methyltransferase